MHKHFAWRFLDTAIDGSRTLECNVQEHNTINIYLVYFEVLGPSSKSLDLLFNICIK